jgi:hypothetical protein
MKNSIAQKVTLNFDSNEVFAVILTKGKKTYQFNYKTEEEARLSFEFYIIDEVKFCSLIGKKTTIGLWQNLEGNDMVCRKQITMNGLY